MSLNIEKVACKAEKVANNADKVGMSDCGDIWRKTAVLLREIANEYKEKIGEDI